MPSPLPPGYLRGYLGTKDKVRNISAEDAKKFGITVSSNGELIETVPGGLAAWRASVKTSA